METLDAQTDPQGVGLAAPQVGVGQAVFIMKPAEDGPTTACINPHILEKKGTARPMTKKKGSQEKRKSDSHNKLEGCLSIPKIWGAVARYPALTLEYQDEKGAVHKKQFSGFEAIIVQHEMDHLQGVLFTSRSLSQDYHLYEERGDELVRIEGV